MTLAAYEENDIGEIGWGWSSIKKGLKKGAKIAKKGAKIAKKGVKYSPAGLATYGALKAGKTGLKVGKKVGKTAWKYKKPIAFGVAAGALGVTALAGKKLAKKAFGPKKPKKIEMPDGETIEPEAVEEETGIPSEAVADAAMEANKAGEDEDARQEAVDNVEEQYGLPSDSLQPIAEATPKLEDEDGEEAGEEMEGIGWSFKGALKSVGSGIKKAAKGGGKLVFKGAKIAGKGALQATTTALQRTAQQYGFGPQEKKSRKLFKSPAVKSALPWVIGGGAALGVILLITRKKS